MAFPTHIFCAPSGTSNYSSTGYGGLLGGGLTSSEAGKQVPSPAAGVFSKLRVYIQTNTRSTTSTFRTRKAGANGNQSVSIASSTTGEFEDNSNSDTVAEGDLFNFEMNLTAGTGNINYSSADIQFLADDGLSYYFPQGGTMSYSGTTIYFAPWEASGNSGETAKLVDAPIFYDLIKFDTYVRTNTRDAAFDITVRKRNVDVAPIENTAFTVSIPTSTTGRFTISGVETYGPKQDIYVRMLASGTTGSASID